MRLPFLPPSAGHSVPAPTVPAGDVYKRQVLHYCKFCNGVVLYASPNDPALAESGLYDHGQYPFVFDPLFVEEDSPAGFGYIDVMKDCLLYTSRCV